MAFGGALLPRSAKNGADPPDPPVVLIIDDEFFVRWNTARYLEDAGYVVVEAATGEEAIALCNSQTSIDLILTDINLGGSADGWDVAECFRSVRPDMPVVYTSGKSLDPGRCVSGSAFVPKPYYEIDILKAYQRLTAGTRSNGAKH